MPDVDLMAVIIAAVAAFIVGALWYSPLLFANAWMAAHGYTPERLESMKQHRTPAQAMAISFICWLVMAFVLSVLAAWAGVGSWDDGVSVGLLVWLGFAATFGLVGNVFSDKSLSAFAIDTGYHFVVLAVMGAIIGGWQ